MNPHLSSHNVLCERERKRLPLVGAVTLGVGGTSGGAVCFLSETCFHHGAHSEGLSSALSIVMMEDTQLEGDQLLHCLFRGNYVGDNILISSLRHFFSTHKPSVCAEVLEFHLMLTHTVADR